MLYNKQKLENKIVFSQLKMSEFDKNLAHPFDGGTQVEEIEEESLNASELRERYKIMWENMMEVYLEKYYSKMAEYQSN